MSNDEIEALARMVDEADQLDGDPDREDEPDGEDAEGQPFLDAEGVIRLPDFAMFAARSEWSWNPHFDGDLDTSAEQWGEPE